MKYFLDDFISTLTPQGAKQAAFMLSDAKIEKEQFKALEAKLAKNMSLGKIQLPQMYTTEIVSGAQISEIFMQMGISVSEIFNRSNNISLLLDNYIGVLGTDIKALENELNVLEKSIDNYAFLIADNGAYDYAYLESFSDERGRDVELETIPDRAGQEFDPSDNATVDMATGTLVSTADYSQDWPISTVNISATNVATLLSETELETLNNLIKPSLDNGWKVSVKSPSLLKGRLQGFQDPEATTTGAQFILEFVLASPAPADTIKIVPFSDWGLTLTEVRTYKDADDSVYDRVWSDNVSITQPYNVHFARSVVSRFRLYLKQPFYRRGIDRPAAAEDRNKKIFDELAGKNIALPENPSTNKNTPMSGSRSSAGWWDQRMIMYLDNKVRTKREDTPFTASIPRSDFRKNWGAFSYRSNSLERKTFVDNKKIWSDQDWTARLVADVVRNIADSEAVWGHAFNSPRQVKPAWANSSNNLRPDRDHTIAHTSASDEPQLTQGKGEGDVSLPYTYKLGMRSVSIGLASPQDRSVYLSRRLDAPGSVGAVRLKSDFVDLDLLDTDKDSPRITSVEFSVSNLSKPIREIDWTPIVPIGTATIVGERLFPDVTGMCKLRFTAKIDADIKIYINGYHQKDYDIKSIARRLGDSNGLAYDAINIPLNQFTSTDVLTVDYTPSHDFTTIEFPPADPTAAPPLVSAYDEGGAGEGFVDSGNQLVITTQQNPYIDYRQVATATYNPIGGLSGYSPITVRFTDGTVAINLTNYKDGSQSVLDPDAENYQYIQSGKTLMFNRVVTKPFRVFYQFQPSDIRVRVVLRCNHSEFVTPRVDFFQLKAKTVKADAKRKL